MTAQTLENSAELVDDQGRKRLTFDILGHDQQRTAGLSDLLKYRDQVAQRPDLVVAQQHEGIFQHSLHALRVGNEVGGYEAAVEFHALDDVQRSFRGLGFLDRNHPFAADLLDGVSNESAD